MVGTSQHPLLSPTSPSLVCQRARLAQEHLRARLAVPWEKYRHLEVASYRTELTPLLSNTRKQNGL